jgi:hypothetical protein
MTNARERSNHLAALLRSEQVAMADFLLALVAFDREKLWRALGHTSLFSYLRRELRLSAGAAQYRKTAAELIHRFPAVEAALRDGHLCLSTIIEVAKVLTPANERDVLPRFFGLSRREAELVAAELRPAEIIPTRTIVTALRPATQASATASPCAAGLDAGARPPPTQAAAPLSLRLAGPDATASQAFRPAEMDESASHSRAEAPARGVDPGASAEPLPIAPAPVRLAPPPPPRASAHPLDAELSRFHATVTRRFLAKLAAGRRTRSRTRSPAPPRRRSWRPASTSSSPRTPGGRGSSTARGRNRRRRSPTASRHT